MSSMSSVMLIILNRGSSHELALDHSIFCLVRNLLRFNTRGPGDMGQGLASVVFSSSSDDFDRLELSPSIYLGIKGRQNLLMTTV